MTYQETLDYLFSRLPMYQRIGAAAYKNDLTNTLALLEHIGNPHRNFLSVHIAGTNGKGSTSHMLAAICQSAGLKTGLYVSPHYKDFRERIKLNGAYISRSTVVSFVEKTRDVIENIQPSFFELCVAMAFDHFAKEKVDVAIVETGLGGRLDSTNVITPLLSVITNISYDHMDLLGNTLPLIAGEKAGIIKPGVPVVIGETHPESAPVFLRKAAETGSDIVFADTNYHVEPLEEGAYRVFFQNKTHYERLAVDAGGPYQQHNIATTLQAAEWLKTILPISDANITDGLANLRAYTRFMGRWQWIGRKPDILCDSAHNEAGIALAFSTINQWMTTGRYQNLHVVCGFVNDKDVQKALTAFPRDATYYIAKANIPRGLDATILLQQAKEAGLKGRAYVSVRSALAAAKRAAETDDLIVVIGSIFVVAEVL